ncbi:unnamed protein product [Penicillium salamii]|uniref:Potassium transport protein n=1 Tax=Penicillium salamii TaxID=1612424 RepID=A0A9W4N2B3_9EURO|nr:unnamed protein product [Penicillium salamii]CAG7978754.1 unnamed protein product [Penicillium salamii]CAG8239648.1 unnamed protein product [Penicillium salamii]CAG8253965.1 unnamed protein product [Penicillium salamii]CAG8348605.1 unnamed protein product [Penicillium salamii]
MFINFKSGWAKIPKFLFSWPTFISIHYAYIIGWTLLTSIVIYPGGAPDLQYVDALFFGSGASTQSGLNTVDVNLLHTYQQVIIWFVAMLTNPIFIHTFVVFVRLYWFEKRFQHVVRKSHDIRRTRSRNRTQTRERIQKDIGREGVGVRDRNIIVLRETLRPLDSDLRQNKVVELDPNDSEKTFGSSNDTITESTGSNPPTLSRQLEADKFRPFRQRDNQPSIAFVEKQRNDKGALRIPSPREYECGGLPQVLDEDEGTMTRSMTAPVQTAHQEGPGSLSDRTKQHKAIDSLHPMPRHRSRTATSPILSTYLTNEMKDEPGSAAVPTTQTRRGTLNSLFRSISHESHVDSMPYLSWNATIGRNSTFVGLTEAQRDELGGIEYRALKTLAVILICYMVGFHLFGITCLVPWIVRAGKYGGYVDSIGLSRTWWGIFTSGSATNDLGFTLTPDSMSSFSDAIFPLLLMSFLIVIGNTGFPCMLRFIIWFLSILVPKGGAVWEELKFLLDHPRRCFTLLFPRVATWWLFAVLVILNGVDLIFFFVLDLNDSDVTSIPAGIRFLDGLFQAVCTRTAGFSVISLSDLHPAIQVSYMFMMYISVFPVAISIRRTNVYEERSLGIYSSTNEHKDGVSKETSYTGTHLRKQLSFDLWYIFLGMFLIVVVEGTALADPNRYYFNLFAVLFEIVSAYGTVGLSMGYPGINASFSAELKTLSKLIIIAMQIRGRHRGLPYELDRAILLPSESLQKKELQDAERRMRRRDSNLSNISTVPTSTIHHTHSTAAESCDQSQKHGGACETPQLPLFRIGRSLVRSRSQLSRTQPGVGQAGEMGGQ